MPALNPDLDATGLGCKVQLSAGFIAVFIFPRMNFLVLFHFPSSHNFICVCNSYNLFSKKTEMKTSHADKTNNMRDLYGDTSDSSPLVSMHAVVYAYVVTFHYAFLPSYLSCQNDSQFETYFITLAKITRVSDCTQIYSLQHSFHLYCRS